MNIWKSCKAVERDPNVVGGAWVFRGTRIPVTALFENIEDGAQISDFVEWFPGEIKEVLEYVAHSLEAA